MPNSIDYYMNGIAYLSHKRQQGETRQQGLIFPSSSMRATRQCRRKLVPNCWAGGLTKFENFQLFLYYICLARQIPINAAIIYSLCNH